MAQVRGAFVGCVQDAQDFGGDDEHMISRVLFWIEVGGRRFDGLHADIRQTVGSSYETGPIEVGPIQGGYRGPMDPDRFRAEVESYYRSLVGSRGRGFRIEGGAEVRMRNNRFAIVQPFEFDVHDEGRRA